MSVCLEYTVCTVPVQTALKELYRCTQSVCISQPGEAEDFSSIPRLVKCWNSLGHWVSLSLLRVNDFVQRESDFNPESVKAKHLWQMLWHLQCVMDILYDYLCDSSSVLFTLPSCRSFETPAPSLNAINECNYIHKLIFQSDFGFLSSNFQPINNRYVVVESWVVLVYFCSSHTHLIFNAWTCRCLMYDRLFNFAFVLHIQGVVWI